MEIHDLVKDPSGRIGHVKEIHAGGKTIKVEFFHGDPSVNYLKEHTSTFPVKKLTKVSQKEASLYWEQMRKTWGTY